MNARHGTYNRYSLSSRAHRTLALQSATYILSATSEPSPSSSTLPPRTTSPPSTPGGEQGHSDAIWCAKWARAAGGGEVVVTAGADHSVKIWCVGLFVPADQIVLTTVCDAGTLRRQPRQHARSDRPNRSESSASTSTKQRRARLSSLRARLIPSSRGGASRVSRRDESSWVLVRLPSSRLHKLQTDVLPSRA